MGKNKPDEYVWVVAYINRDHIGRVEEDLKVVGLSAIKVFIPTVRILKKQFKNKNIYEYVPLLFNYGFFQLPLIKACDYAFLKYLRENVYAIHSWVSDPMRIITEKPNLRMDNKEGVVNVAIARDNELADLLKMSDKLSVFSDAISDKLEVGSFLILKGYPYEGMPAEIVTINKTKKQVKVRLLLETMIAETVVNFENIFYTVYSDYDGAPKEDSLDEISDRSKRGLDKLYAKINYGTD